MQKMGLTILILLHLILALNGLTAGILFLVKPNGSLLGMNSQWLSGSIFTNFRIPGLLLFLFMGVLPLTTVFGLIGKGRESSIDRLNIYRDRHWAWSFSIYTGIMCVSWISIQQMISSYFWLQPIVTAIGVLILILTLTPALMRKFEKVPA